MALITLSSPHIHGGNRTQQFMRTVIFAALPGLLLQCYFFGFGSLIQTALAISACVGFEALILTLRGKPASFYLRDYSALLTGLLLGIALPPLAPFWVTLVAAFFAIVVAKQLYGGLGQNPFNPAMVGYALVLVSFPVQMTTTWTQSFQMTGQSGLTLLDSLAVIFAGLPIADGISGATPLDAYKHLIGSATGDVIRQTATFNGWLNGGMDWVNFAFLAGGLYLLWARIITWHIPAAMLIALSLCSLILGFDDDLYTPLHLHLFSGATMLGAFFIATDPVSASTTPRGKLIYGAGIGIFVYVIRTWGSYPDAVAFAVLLMNFAAPFIDAYTQPRSAGHTKAKRGLPPKA